MSLKTFLLLTGYYGLLAIGWIRIGWQCPVLMLLASTLTALIMSSAARDDEDEEKEDEDK